MEETIYLVSDGRGEVFAACDLDGLGPVLEARAAHITHDFKIDLRLDDDEPKAVVRFYASSDSSWLYHYPIRKMPLIRGSRAR